MKNLALALAAASLGSTPTQVHAEDSWAFTGLGGATCAEALSDEGSILIEMGYGQWALGFWSGLNMGVIEKTGSFVQLNVFRDEMQVAKAVFSECRERPSETFILAALKVYGRLGAAGLNQLDR